MSIYLKVGPGCGSMSCSNHRNDALTLQADVDLLESWSRMWFNVMFKYRNDALTLQADVDLLESWSRMWFNVMF